MKEGADLIVLGGRGRIGRMLARIWAQTPPDGLRMRFHGRFPSSTVDLSGDFLNGGLPDLPDDGRDRVVLNLAWDPTNPPDSGNQGLTAATIDWAKRQGARAYIFASSHAVYVPSDTPVDEAAPVTDRGYGGQKAACETIVLGAAAPDFATTCLRLGNVAGADSLACIGARDPETVLLHQFKDGLGPIRSYIGPVALADVCARMALRAAAGQVLPAIMNVAQPGAVAMSGLIRAAGAELTWSPAPKAARQWAVADTDLLADTLGPVPPADPADLVRQLGRVAQ